MRTVSGPSGVGKDTVVRELVRRHARFMTCVSETTRSQREGETDGVDYIFVDDERFDDDVKNGRMLEWQEVHGHRYGTPVSELRRVWLTGFGNVATLVLDPSGAKVLRMSEPHVMSVFLVPPSVEELERRLVARGTESVEEVGRRMADAREWMRDVEWYDRRVTNDDVVRCADEIARACAEWVSRVREPSHGVLDV